MAKKISIVVLSGVSAGDVFRFDLEKSPDVNIGRASENNLVLQDPSVSRAHARISLVGEAILLQDLGSSHGTVHMGFPVKGGETGRRQLQNEDEFKIGDAIFRIEYSPADFGAVKKVEKVTPVDSAIHPAAPKKTKKLILALVGAVAVMGLAALLFGGGPTGLPPQKSNEIISFTDRREGVIGYWRGGSEKGKSDLAHADKAQFEIPGSDLLVEFEVISGAPVAILLDNIPLVTVEPAGSWEYRQVIIRDLQQGRERALVFDNTDWPKKGAPEGSLPSKNWAVRNVRMTALSHDRATRLDSELSTAYASADTLDSVPSSLFTTVRAFQHLLLAYLTEQNRDALVYELPLESILPGSIELRDQVSAMIEERKLGVGPEMGNRHIEVLQGIIGRLEAELWRRVKSRITKAQLASDSKNFIDAYDNLMYIKSMFPDEEDYRWTLANRMVNDDKIVKKAVRKNPAKFRKKALRPD